MCKFELSEYIFLYFVLIILQPLQNIICVVFFILTNFHSSYGVKILYLTISDLFYYYFKFFQFN